MKVMKNELAELMGGIEDVLDYYRNGLLCRWLKVRGYEEELKKVEEIRSEDSMGIIKELIRIFEIPCDPAEVEKSIYILKYKVESESENEQYKQESYKVEGIIEDYRQGYRSLLNTIFENQNDAAQIKAAIQEIVEKYKWVLQYVPKGIMIIGMPGCGKSLTAKATASLFEIPLVRLDVGRLLGKYVGESEENMRNALKLSEAISPCVLWIDEIEKAFAGVGGEGGGNDVTTRLFGQFLTWMQEKENTVFIVATANDISRLPPEFLRKGRFDELFFVDLPNGTERRKILEIHLKKRKKWNENIDSIALIKETEGYNGADLEAVVKDTIERAFIDGRTTITTADLIRSIKDTKSISCTLKDKIASIQKTVEKIDIKPASLDDKKEKEPDPHRCI